jgi:chromosome segregation ATPase
MENRIKTIQNKCRLTTFTILYLLLCISHVKAFSDPVKITTTRPPQTIILTYQPEEAVDVTSLHSIIQTAKTAIDGLNADAAAEATEVATATRDVKEKNTSYQKTENEYKDKLASYNIRLDAYNQHLEPYKTELSSYTGEVNSYNSKPQDQRDQGTYDKLASWKRNLDAKKSKLDNERVPLLNEKNNILDPLYNNMLQKKEAVNTAVSKIKNLKLDMGSAFKQLVYCRDYVTRAYKIAQQRNWTIQEYRTAADFFGSVKANPSIEMLNSELEKMKNDADIPWDGAK